MFEFEEAHYPHRISSRDVDSQFLAALSAEERGISQALIADLGRPQDNQRLSVKHTASYRTLGGASMPQREKLVMRHTEKLDDFSLDEIIFNAKPNAFYANLLTVQSRKFELSRYVLANQGTITEHDSYFAEWSGGPAIEIRPWQMREFCSRIGDNMEQLVAILKTLRSIREYVNQAAECSYLSEEELSALKLKLSAFDTNSQYSLATTLVPYALESDRCLVDSSRERWW